MEKISLLIVDDEKNVLSSLQRLFHDPAYEVYTATSSEEAFRLLKNHPIGVIICDQKLAGGAEGTDFLALTKVQWPDTSRILLTGFFNAHIAYESVKNGEVYRFLSKPWHDEDLKITVKNSWQRHILLKQNRELLNLIRSQNDHLKHLTKNLESVIENRIEKTIQSQKAIQSKKIQLQITHTLIQGLHRSKNLRDIYKIVVQELQKIIRLDAASILVQLQSQKFMLITDQKEIPISIEKFPDLKQILQDQTAKIVSTVPKVFKDGKHTYRSGLVFPLHTMATLNLASFFKNAFSKEDILKLQEIAHPIAIAIEKMKLLETVEQASQQWESTFDAISDLVTVIDPTFTLIKANRATEMITHKKVETVIGKKCYQVLAGRTTPCENCPAVDALKQLEKIDQHEIKDFKNKDYVSWAFPVLNTQRQISSIVLYYRDQTELTSLFRQLIQSEKMAAIGHLASALSHELNNPLTGITAFSQILMKELGKEHPFYTDLHEIEKASLRCKEIIENLLTFSETPKQAKKTWVHVHPIIDATFPLIQYSQSSTHPVAIVKKYFSHLPKIKANPNELQQVFFNLFLNAIQAMPKGGTLIVTTQVLPKKEGIQISISDTGIGISKKDLSKIFNPFYTTKEKSRGTGLGLSVSEGIIRTHQGRIEVKSKEKKGSTFKVILPLKENQ
ncbi:MAG: response regulator [Deltaproteobacteria bacterium]|nr:response regulator [Deltaproteobacteria bacterium]